MIKFKGYFINLFVLVFIVLFSSGAYAAAKDVATVIAVKGGAYVVRDGFKSEVKLKTPLFVTDKIVTDANGKMQILFNDDTSLSVGSNSEISIDDFSFGGSAKPKFAVKAVKGVSKVISGQVVEQNPDGFKVSTPSATIGIRGTIVGVNVGNGKDSILVQQLGRGHTVTVQSNSGEFTTLDRQGLMVVVDSKSGSHSVQEITSNENLDLNSQVSIETSSDTSSGTSNSGDKSKNNDEASSPAGSTGASAEGNSKSTKTQETVASSNSLVENVKKTNEDVVNSNTDKKINDPTKDNPAIKPPTSTVAYYKGSIAAETVGIMIINSGNFGFKVDLGKGIVSEAYVSTSTNLGNFVAKNGAGTVTKNNDGGYFFDAAGYTFNGNGIFSSSLFDVSSKGSIYQNDRVVDTFIDIAGGNLDKIRLSGDGTRTDKLDKPQLDPFNSSSVKVNYYGTLTLNDHETYGAYPNVSGKTTFTADLLTGLVSNAQFYVYSGTADYGVEAYVYGRKGTGTISNVGSGSMGLKINYTDAQNSSSFDEGIPYFRDALFDGNITGDSFLGTWKVFISGDPTNILFSGGFSGGVDNRPAGVVAHYQGARNDAATGASDYSYGFSLDLSTGRAFNAFLVLSDSLGGFTAKNGYGIVSDTLVNNNCASSTMCSVAKLGNFNVESQYGYYKYVNHVNGAVTLYDDDYRMNFVAGINKEGEEYKATTTVNNLVATETTQLNIPNQPAQDITASYYSDSTMPYDNYNRKIGFNVHFKNDTVTDAYVYKEAKDLSEGFLATNGSGTLGASQGYKIPYSISGFSVDGYGANYSNITNVNVTGFVSDKNYYNSVEVDIKRASGGDLTDVIYDLNKVETLPAAPTLTKP